MKIILIILALQFSMITNAQTNDGLVAKSVGVTPIGGVVAWFPPPNQTEPPKGWVKCNGQTLNEKQSTFNGTKIPDLNKTKLFLRGGEIAGKSEEQDWKSLKVTSNNVSSFIHGPTLIRKSGNHNVNFYSGAGGKDLNGNVATIQFKWDESEIRPKNMSVIWIMRIY